MLTVHYTEHRLVSITKFTCSFYNVNPCARGRVHTSSHAAAELANIARIVSKYSSSGTRAQLCAAAGAMNAPFVCAAAGAMSAAAGAVSAPFALSRRRVDATIHRISNSAEASREEEVCVLPDEFVRY